jgi:signal transduction histidine kinase
MLDVRLQDEAEVGLAQYRQDVAATSIQASIQADDARRLVPVLSLVVGVVASIAEPGSASDLILIAAPVAAFIAWTSTPSMPLTALSLAVIVPVVVAQRSGQLEPLMFEVSLLGFVVGRWSASLRMAVTLGFLAAMAPVAASIVQNRSEISAGIWILGIAFPWVMARVFVRQAELSAQLDAVRRELAEQALLAERRRIARDVHDLVGHGLAAMMLQVTSARHVLRRDPPAAEEALRSAEGIGRRSMQELRRTVSLLRSGEETGTAPPLPSTREIPALVDEARAGGIAVELRMRGDLSGIAPGVGLAAYRIAQETLANAARHAPRARTVLRLETTGDRISLVAETTGLGLAPAAGDPDRPRYGVVGMRERAMALGGELAAGPTVNGWRVSCWLPLDADGERPAGGS